MNTWIEEQKEDHFRLCLREVKTFDGKHQNIQVVSVLLSPGFYYYIRSAFYVVIQSFWLMLHIKVPYFLD